MIFLSQVLDVGWRNVWKLSGEFGLWWRWPVWFSTFKLNIKWEASSVRDVIIKLKQHSDFIYNLEGEIGHSRDMTRRQTSTDWRRIMKEESKLIDKFGPTITQKKPTLKVWPVTVSEENKNAEKDKCLEFLWNELLHLLDVWRLWHNLKVLYFWIK